MPGFGGSRQSVSGGKTQKADEQFDGISQQLCSISRPSGEATRMDAYSLTPTVDPAATTFFGRCCPS